MGLGSVGRHRKLTTVDFHGCRSPMPRRACTVNAPTGGVPAEVDGKRTRVSLDSRTATKPVRTHFQGGSRSEPSLFSLIPTR
jgi:hypothetical protein